VKNLLKKIFKKRINKILEKYQDENILITDEMSNFFGQESFSVWKVRGNGVLLLTDEKLFFEMWKPKKEVQIPIKSITKISNPKSHMHKTALQPLLKVWFKNESGEEDSAAWWVHELDKWNNVLNRLIKEV